MIVLTITSGAAGNPVVAGFLDTDQAGAIVLAVRIWTAGGVTGLSVIKGLPKQNSAEKA